MISIRNVSRRFADITALQDVTVNIEENQVVGLLGHNGAGKSTLLRVMTGLLEPSSGSITYGDRPLETHKQQILASIGYLPETAPLYSDMWVQEYLLMVAAYRGIAPNEQKNKVIQASKRVGIDGVMTQQIGTLSRGFKQRVGLAQAIIHEPEVLILDEPTAGLDPTQRQAIRVLIRELAKTTTIIVSTHILQEIEAMCDSVIVLVEGRVAAASSLQDLLKSDRTCIYLESVVADPGAVFQQLTGFIRAEEVDDPSCPEGYRAWSIVHTPEVQVGSELVALASKKDWTINAVFKERRHLDTVFQEFKGSPDPLPEDGAP